VQCAVCSVQCAGFVCALYVCMHLSNSTGVNEVRLVRVCVDVCILMWLCLCVCACVHMLAYISMSLSLFLSVSE